MERVYRHCSHDLILSQCQCQLTCHPWTLGIVILVKGLGSFAGGPGQCHGSTEAARPLLPSRRLSSEAPECSAISILPLREHCLQSYLHFFPIHGGHFGLLPQGKCIRDRFVGGFGGDDEGVPSLLDLCDGLNIFGSCDEVIWQAWKRQTGRRIFVR